MAAIELLTSNLFILGVSLIISALPLYVAVKVVGGEVSLLKVVLLSIVVSAVSLATFTFLGVYASILTLPMTSIVYKLAFKLTIGKSILVWFLQYLIAFVIALLGTYIFTV